MVRCFAAFVLAGLCVQAQPAPERLRPPATPLIAHDPYFSIWSTTDVLTESPTRHWTGKDHPLTGLIRIDGKPFRYMGNQPRDVPALPQISRELTPTRTIYQFQGEGVQLTLTFMTPALPADLDILSRPVTYLIFDARATDGRPHAVALSLDAAAQIATNAPEQAVLSSRYRVGELTVLRTGTTEQPVLAKSGDDLRIDWGYLYLAGAAEMAVSSRASRDAYAHTGSWPQSDDLEQPRPASENPPLLSAKFDLGQVAAESVSRRLMIAYDDVFAIEYFQRKLRPYWRRNGMTIEALLRAADADYESLRSRCVRFDADVAADLTKAGGAHYAELATLAFRQTLAAHKLVADLDGTPLYFSKENFSNGSIDTVDVTYPSSPFFLLFNPELLKAQLRPILDYSSLSRWPWSYAPHDLGKFPRANGQLYGGGEKTEENQMPVEESGNMLIMVEALAKIQNDATFAAKYWPVLTKWTNYLREKGLDPENQLSTDDFAGHLAHNTNLSIKAILAIDCYAELAQRLGKKQEADTNHRIAREMAAKWVSMAQDNGHYRLAFDKPGTWSQKYNLVWDKILNLHLFPESVVKTEIAFYKTKQNAYGLPLDNRETYTKLDWLIWTATLADSPQDFAAIAEPGWRFANESPTHVPLSDWYWTLDAKQRGFQARSVVGGIFIKMLADPAMWRKWAQAK